MKKSIFSFITLSAFMMVSFFVSPATAIDLGTGSKAGVFNIIGHKTVEKTAADFVYPNVLNTKGSGFNVEAVNAGTMETGLAMLTVAMGSGLPYKELQIAEGSFIVANQAVADVILARVQGNEDAVFAAALKLASMGRVVFVTMGEKSGETVIIRDQLAKVGAPETALVVVKDEAQFLSKLENSENAFGYFTRVPLSDNGIFVNIDKKNFKLMGAFNPAFKMEGMKMLVVNVAGVEIKTPSMPIAIVYKDEASEDVAAVVKAAQSLVLEDLVTKKGKFAKWAEKFKKWSSKATAMTSDAVSGLSSKVKDLVDNM